MGHDSARIRDLLLVEISVQNASTVERHGLILRPVRAVVAVGRVLSRILGPSLHPVTLLDRNGAVPSPNGAILL
jgi:hypothetical protein